MSKNQELNHPQPSRRTNQNSYAADEDTFVKEDVAITSTGVAMLGKPKLFTVVPQELEAGTPIGRGASSYVLKSKHVPTGTCLALKVMNMYDKGKREQLIREIRTLYDAQCPCLVKFFGAFYRDSTITIALEYMDGGALENVIEQVESIPEPILANITYQILYGLSYLHRHNHVHRGRPDVFDLYVIRIFIHIYSHDEWIFTITFTHYSIIDIKPSNILINSQGQVKVTDFGIAAEVCNTTPLCTSYVGTFKYMSPERIRRHAYGYSSDIWSLGLVILGSYA